MNKANFNFLLTKYAIALSITYIFGYIWVFVFHNFMDVGKTYSAMEYDCLRDLPTITGLVINIIIAFMIAYDMKKYGSINWLIVILSAVLGLVGVVLFFIHKLMAAQSLAKET